MNKKLTVKADVDVAHNYSTQTLNSTDLAKEKLRQILAKVCTMIKDISHTYNYVHHIHLILKSCQIYKISIPTGIFTYV